MNLEWLKENLDQEMMKSMMSKTTQMFLTPGLVDKRYYALYLTETYHYTFHNSRNQAMVATRKENLNINYMKFCLKHALEEAGHEMMALHDLKVLLGKQQIELAEPLDSTQALVDHIYAVAANGNPLARLGYSFWAERIYSYIAPMLNLLNQGMGVEKKAMTFFVEHSDIDAEHSKEVDQAIKQFAKTDEDWKAINEVMLSTLKLTRDMTDEIMKEFVNLKEGKPSRYAHYFS